ncbi:CG43327, partial [Drosophila busckii]
FNFMAHKNYNKAVKRNLYFSYRLPDWTNDYLTHTSNILSESFAETKRLTDLRTKPARLQSESNSLQELLHKSNAIRPPKIKDDITCGKRVLT